MSRKPWSYANLWEPIAATLPAAPALIRGEEQVTWAQFDARADALAADLLAAGLGKQSKVAIYAGNCPEYLVACYAAFKAGLVPYNVNYRYGAEEVLYLLQNGDAEAVVFEARYAGLLDGIRGELPLVTRWLAVPTPEAAAPDWAGDFREATAGSPAERPVHGPWGRDGDDLLMLYTGGTTGMPKGVMWRQYDLIGRGGFGANPALGLPPLAAPEQAGEQALASPRRPRSLIACPLMHGTGIISALMTLSQGGAVILLPPGRFDPVQLWDAAQQHQASRVAIVGDPFAAPMTEALEAHPGRWNLSRLAFISSSGAMWSREVKQRLLRHLPQLALMDSFASSEAIGMGSSITTADKEHTTGRFQIGPDCAVFNEQGERVAPGSGERGRVAIGGHIPQGYYMDAAKTAETFPVIEGRRWSMPGDWAEVDAEGNLILLGRGSQCINTGGEKVFPEEVEEALKRHPSVRDAAVTGIPHSRYGEQVVALVEPVAGAEIEPALLRDHVKSQLAHYKAPRHVWAVESVARSPNGKLDYKAVKARALALAPQESDSGTRSQSA